MSTLQVRATVRAFEFTRCFVSPSRRVLQVASNYWHFVHSPRLKAILLHAARVRRQRQRTREGGMSERGRGERGRRERERENTTRSRLAHVKVARRKSRWENAQKRVDEENVKERQKDMEVGWHAVRPLSPVFFAHSIPLSIVSSPSASFAEPRRSLARVLLALHPNTRDPDSVPCLLTRKILKVGLYEDRLQFLRRIVIVRDVKNREHINQ